ncbi:MAG: hypothetical protein JO271_13095 [Verrucomicrobia bacterium]|nr:hypothetical protein [Verrucomicrobiota bacterium]
MKRRGEFPGIATVDVCINLVLVFAVLLRLSIVMINAEQQKNQLQNHAAFLVKINWPGESNDDVDLYVADPLNNIVYFRQKQIGLMSLDRDDTGHQQNMVTLPDGRVVQSQFNEEQVNIRGIVEGEYVVNVHMYRKSDNRPTKVEIALFKSSGGDQMEVHKQVVTLSAERQEETAFRFTLTKDGDVVGVNRLPRRFVDQLQNSRRRQL